MDFAPEIHDADSDAKYPRERRGCIVLRPRIRPLIGGRKREGNILGHLLSDEVWGMCSLHLEGAVLSPQVNRVGDARTTSFVDLK